MNREFVIDNEKKDECVQMPQRLGQMPDDAQLLAKLKRLYRPRHSPRSAGSAKTRRRLAANEEAEVLREGFFRRMWEGRFFMKGLMASSEVAQINDVQGRLGGVRRL